MATRIRKGTLLTLPLDPDAATPLFRQVYEGLRRGILDGTLAPGVRLPATRGLADELGVSRNTVLNAYEQLLAEGYLEGKVGSGTYVPRTLPEETLQVRPAVPPARTPTPQRPTLSRRGELLARWGGGRNPGDETPTDQRPNAPTWHGASIAQRRLAAAGVNAAGPSPLAIGEPPNRTVTHPGARPGGLGSSTNPGVRR